MRTRRTGFTLVEILIVITIVGILSAIAMPKITQWRARSRLTSARQVLTASIAMARAAAVQKGFTSRLRLGNNEILVEVDTSSVPGVPKLAIIKRVSLLEEYGATVVFVADSDVQSTMDLYYDPRGFAQPRLPAVGGPNVFRLAAGARTDSVCLARLGQILPRGCTP
ncbi:MAG TPA: prepilin-type N-terminal cleavage/methylation domain-containing protein [Gemmatimonadaceae bacterium]|nr:prepilin-type N-terminal cleavage/methylation domain-containing protein [Gemmatimonadaceae bacterium]